MEQLQANKETRRNERKFPRISRPFEQIRYEYDVVVVGSGYGGAVAASRMARGGQSVCVLERGKERWPGEYPITLAESMPELHVSGDFAPDDDSGIEVDKGSLTGLYHLVVGEGQNAFVANGLGGTSLLNANVFLRADAKTMAMKAWPPEIRGKYVLDPYYQLAEDMLQPAPYPADFPTLPKLQLLEEQAKALGHGDKFYRVPQTTRFEDGPNSTGVNMRASTLTGQDSTGVNDGSKSSTLVNYLSDAWNWTAEMFCECEVRRVAKAPSGGYNVFFAWHGGKRAQFKKNIYMDLLWVHAKKFVFLGAGSLGTTEILLRSKDSGLAMSSNVGTGMSGNGDILAFGYNCKPQVDSMGRPSPPPERPVGPTITGIIDCRDQENALNGYVIEEGAVPAALTTVLQDMLAKLPGKIYPKNDNFRNAIRRQLAALNSRIFGPYHPTGSLEHTQIYLIMSHDDNQAIMTLVDDKPMLKFMGVGRSEHVKHLNRVLAKATSAVGGVHVNSPFFAALRQQEITVHPIGGACMSGDGSADLGTTTHLGELLTGRRREYHEGLVVVDGALVPTSLGVNPFATITALAERSVQGVAEKHGIQIDYATKNGRTSQVVTSASEAQLADQVIGLLDLFGRPAHGDSSTTTLFTTATPTIEFTEIMSGFIHIGNEIDDFVAASNAAKASSQSARFFLTMHAWDENELLNGKHYGNLTGTFTHGALPASPYMVLKGRFRLFNDDPRTPDTKNLTYDFDMIGTDGSKLHFNGYKVVNESAFGSLYQLWKQTSTLYVMITDSDGQMLGKGMLRIALPDLVHELQTLTAAGSSILARLTSISHFFSFFARNVMEVLLGPLGFLQWPSITSAAHEYKIQAPIATYHVTADDGVTSPLLIYEPESDEVLNKPPILFVPGAAVDHQIFALPTIKHNAIDYFTSKGYRCYILTHRVGRSPEAQEGWTSFDARKDVKAALKFIRKQRDAAKIYVICHCAGSVATSSGLLDGTIPKDWILGLTASNVFFSPIFAEINKRKASLSLPLIKVYSKLVGQWYPCTSSRNDGFVQRLLNQALRLYPVGSKKELCNSIVCHRSELAFGRLWTHANLNEATHSQLDHFLGGTSMRALTHLVASGLAGSVLTNNRVSLVNDTNLERLRGLPIFFFSGSENAVYSPESTDVSFSMLRTRFGPDNYERRVFQGKGHLDCWMSESAAKDVWPKVCRHVKQTSKSV